MFDDKDLRELMEIISGTGKWKFLGGIGFHTYPTGDENNKKLFDMCVELEKRSLVYRVIDEQEHVCFRAVGSPAG